jgi:hypothetical protein
MITATAAIIVLAADQVTCWLCGDLLHLAISEAADEFVWVGQDGHQMGVDSDMRQLPGADPYARLAFLSRELDRAHAARRASFTWLYHAYVREYSALKVRMDFGGTHHVHQSSSHPQVWDGPPPEHCGWPAWLRPSGWHCRQCGELLEEAA